ncbi:MAG: DNA double-strand break repair nuclease NurA [Candidatus Bathyarchaeota archaeon]|nr:DNA double-strand break repair nuclease NurA [Candidatus Bathyarchaeum tardum]WGM89666.1 MAG: DNA double-strand break repair nuclease NurA [Candidatus Bathyarchaeum tardum]WNZ30234.1 MAG: DNA double-strand break repair nuclease NurA [Candidatus Bathyarchaeota archaeon]
MSKIQKNLTELKTKLKLYVDKGRQIGFSDVKPQPLIISKPDIAKIKPLQKIKNCNSRFFAVDCSTRTLKRAHNWGIYLMRVAYASVENRKVTWDYEESIVCAVGDRRYRSNFLIDNRLQIESEMALKLIHEEATPGSSGEDTLRELGAGDYILLDGASFFGGKRGFHTSLYEEALRKKINLLAISKQSPMLCDEKGRDFMASTSVLTPYSLWVYHPVKEANMEKHLYGDVSLVKLCEDSKHIFRCDIMDSTSQNVTELLSPLTSLSEDPRCLGYPVTLWLAHEFSGASASKLLQYYDLIEKELETAGILETLRVEELSCSFADKIHGITNLFEGDESFDRI